MYNDYCKQKNKLIFIRLTAVIILLWEIVMMLICWRGQFNFLHRESHRYIM